MKMRESTRRAVRAFLVFLLMAGVFGAMIVVCRLYLRDHGLESKARRYALGCVMFVGYYFIYRWFSRRIGGGKG